MAFQLTPNVSVQRDESGRVVALTHLFDPFQVAGARPTSVRELAAQYVADVAPIYGFAAGMEAPSLESVPRTLGDGPERLYFEREKQVANLAVVSFTQAWRGLPVWNGVVGVRINPDAMAVIGSTSQVLDNLNVQLPADLQSAPYMPERLTSATLAKLLGVQARGGEPAISAKQLVVYRIGTEERVRPEGPGTPSPDNLPLPLLDNGRFPDGSDHVVVDVKFRLSRPGSEGMFWTALVEPASGAVVLLRAHTSDANGAIFQIDPVTQGCPTCTGSSSGATLDLYRTQLPLDGLNAPAPGSPQALTGNFIALQFVSGPPYTPPTQPVGTDFIYSSTTPEFASVNAYYHCDLLYRYVQGMGINIGTYFDGTTFPIPTDAIALGGELNAQAKGNASGNGMGAYVFGVAATGSTVGISADYRVVLHEFGHALLWDHVRSPNFGFAHSAGDSMAAIFADPTSQALDKGLTFPFIPAINRRQDRQVSAGWAWFGTQYNTQYNGEQVLSTTLFRAYQSTGGGSTILAYKIFASQYMFYLIVKSCGLLTAMTPDPVVYVNALIEADMTTTNFQGQVGGTNYKVIRWSFEKQGLYQPPNTAKPYTKPGVPPATDVFIDDGRAGEYTYQANWTANQNVWNRLAPDGGTSHQNPVSGAVNYAYVRVQNRGTGAANNATVRGFQGQLGSEFNWPGNWTALTTAQVAAPGPIASGGSVVLGPLQWTPAASGGGSLLMVAAADGDPSIVDNPLIAGLLIPNWRLVPFDNNIAQRNVTIS
jgi:zinc metalloprotease ZmpB